MKRVGLFCCVILAACQSPQVVDDEKEGGVEGAIAEADIVVLPEGFDVQGHRGARGLRPESTLPSFEVALDLMVDTIEVDLHLSKDDRLIIWHDPFIEARKCSVPEGVDLPDPQRLPSDHPDLLVRNLTAEQLAQYQCHRNPDPQRFPDQTDQPTAIAGGDYSIVTLTQLFDFVDEYAESPKKTDGQRQNARTLRFNIETKRVPEQPEFVDDGFDGESPATFERRLVELIEERGLQERVMMQSFDHRSLWAARTLAGWLELAVLDREIETPFEIFRERGATIWSPRARLVDSTSLKDAQSAGLRVIPWTVNDAVEMERLIGLGVDGIITDRPDLLVKYRYDQGGEQSSLGSRAPIPEARGTIK